MSFEKATDFTVDLNAYLALAFALLERAVIERHSPMHIVSIASIGLDGRPRNRIVVLRAFDADLRLLRFHTDLRSDKFEELGADQRVALLFYDPETKIQLRIEGQAELHKDDAIADHAWQTSYASSRQAYGTEPAPGSVIPEGHAFKVPENTDDAAAGRRHFAAVRVRCERLECLWLGDTGHRRALFEWKAAEAEPVMRWLVP